MRRPAAALLAAVLVVVLAATGCTSSGGLASPGVAAVESALKGDATVQRAFGVLGANAKAHALAYTCLAKAVIRDADTGDLVAYVSGNKSLGDLGGATITRDVEGCARSSLRIATGG